MTVTDSLLAQFRPSPQNTTAPASWRASSLELTARADNPKKDGIDVLTVSEDGLDESGAKRIEALQPVWGRHGKKYIIFGLALVMLCYEFSNSTTWTLESYATSSFNDLSLLATLNTAATILFAVVKPPIAKISDAIGRR